MLELGCVKRFTNIDAVEVDMWDDWTAIVRLYKDGKLVKELFFHTSISEDTFLVAESFEEYREICRDFYDLDKYKCIRCGAIFSRSNENEVFCPRCRKEVGR